MKHSNHAQGQTCTTEVVRSLLGTDILTPFEDKVLTGTTDLE